jgi:small subunit ribosomal protein S6
LGLGAIPWKEVLHLVRNYELVFIVHPDLEQDELNAVVERVKDLVERSDGKVEQIEPWGLRRLAYPVQKRWEGQYVLMRLELEPQSVTQLEHRLGLTEQIMRHLIVRVEESAGEDRSDEAVVM